MAEDVRHDGLDGLGSGSWSSASARGLRLKHDTCRFEPVCDCPTPAPRDRLTGSRGGEGQMRIGQSTGYWWSPMDRVTWDRRRRRGALGPRARRVERGRSSFDCPVRVVGGG